MKHPRIINWVITGILCCIGLCGAYGQDIDISTYLAAEKLAALGHYRVAFDSMRVFCETYDTATPPRSSYLDGGFRKVAGYALAEKYKTGSTTMIYEVYTWLVQMQPRNPDCTYYQAGIFAGLANLLGKDGLFKLNEQCNMWWNYTQLCPDHGWRDSMFFGFIESTREFQRELEDTTLRDTTAFELFDYPLKPLTSSVGSSTATDLIKAELSPNPATSEVRLYVQTKNDHSFKITLNDLLGRIIKHLPNEHSVAGDMDMTVDLSGLSAGLYYLRLRSGGFVLTRKLLIQ